MKKIKLFGILTFLLMGIAVPQNEMLKVDAASNDTELLSYVYDLFADENIVEYDDINYFMSVPEEGVEQYQVNQCINSFIGSELSNLSDQTKAYYPHAYEKKSYYQINDILFNNFWNFSHRALALDEMFYLESSVTGEYPDIEEQFRKFDFGGNTQTNPDFYYEANNTSSTEFTKEDLLVNPGISYMGIEGENSVYRKSSFASLGGVSLLQNSCYLNSSFDGSLKENNNLEIAFTNVSDVGYEFSDFIKYNQVLAGFFAEDTFYNYPLIKVNNEPFVYVVFEGTGGDTNTNFLPHLVCINSKIRFDYVLDNFGFYLSIPYHEYIETISFTLPYYTSTYCPDIEDQYCNETFDDKYESIFDEVADFMSLAPIWWNDEIPENVEDMVKHHPVSISDIDAENHTVTLKCFNNQWTDINEPVPDYLTLYDVSGDGEDYTYTLPLFTPAESSSNDEGYKGAYSYFTYSLYEQLIPFESSRTFKTDIYFDTYCLYDDIPFGDYYFYNSDSNEYGNMMKFRKNRTKQQVFLDPFISKSQFFATVIAGNTGYASIYFSFYSSKNKIKNIKNIDNVFISYKYLAGNHRSVTIDSTTKCSWKGRDGEEYYFYKFMNYCPYALNADYREETEYFHCLVPGNLFGENMSIAPNFWDRDRIEHYDFEIYHKLNPLKYRKCGYDSVIQAKCDFWIDKNTYVVGGFGENAYSVEYDDDGNFIGVTDINGNIVPDLSVDDTGTIIDENGNPIVDDTIIHSYSYSYFGKYMDGLFDDFKSGFKSTFSLDGNFGKILSVIGILVVIVIVIKLYPSIKKMLSKSRNKKKRA